MRDDTCVAPGCLKKRYVRNGSAHCPMHSWRLKKHGSYDLPVRTAVPKYVEQAWYAKGHKEWKHRTILRAVIGEAPHPCHWCNKMLSWGVDLFVDHVDENKLNNDPHNLVPSCHSCNVNRSRRPVSHCKRGHEFTTANTYINATSGARVCRSCVAGHRAEWQRKNPEYKAQWQRDNRAAKKAARLVAERMSA